MKIINCEQKSKEWLDIRKCKVTATKLEEVMGTPLARVQLIAELIGEELTMTADAEKSWVTPAMERGNEEEPKTIELFEKKTGNKVRSVGFCIHDYFDWFGYSPDGLFNENEDCIDGIEMKNPNTKTFVFYQLTNLVGMEELGLGTWSKKENTFTPSAKAPFLGVPADYKWQVVAGFMINEKQKRLHFLVHDSRITDPEKQLYIVVVNRENELLQEAMKEADEALIKFRADWLKWRDIILKK